MDQWRRDSAHRVFLLFDLQHRPILKCPFHYICLGRYTLHMLALLQLTPEFVEVLELDEMPDLAERGGNDCGLADGGGGWDCGGHLG